MHPLVLFCQKNLVRALWRCSLPSCCFVNSFVGLLSCSFSCLPFVLFIFLNFFLFPPMLSRQVFPSSHHPAGGEVFCTLLLSNFETGVLATLLPVPLPGSVLSTLASSLAGVWLEEGSVLSTPPSFSSFFSIKDWISSAVSFLDFRLGPAYSFQ